MKWVLPAILLLVAAAPAQDAGWKRYDNARFGYSVCYPPELVPQREADDGDGREFKSRDGKVTARAYGGYEMTVNGNKASLSAELGYALDYAKQKGYVVGYKVVKPHAFVLSGQSPSGMVWYRRTIDVQDRAVTVEFEYPQGLKPQMDPVVAKMSACLVAGRMSY